MALLVSVQPAWTQGLTGRATIELRGFPVPATREGPPGATVSVAGQPEAYWAWSDGQSLLAVLFGRFDSADSARTHVDVRELLWRLARARWELRAGVGKVFWGVAESQHLVDIVNQTDFVENVDGDEKLGQPMVVFTLSPRWGTVDLFLLPGFRERTFAGPSGRFQFPLRIATERPEFASAVGARHVDWAVRWFHTIGRWDIGGSHFRGTGREPWFRLDPGDGGEPVLVPRYEQIDQTGLDLQMQRQAWLWKLEAITRGGQGDRFGQGGRFTALTGGFERTWTNLGGTGRDIGLLVEYLLDSRGRLATTPFEDDLFLGTRVAFNDVQTSRLLAGVIVDRRFGTAFVNVEASRRLGTSWTVAVEARMFGGLRPDDYLYGFRRDHYAQLELSRYF